MDTFKADRGTVAFSAISGAVLSDDVSTRTAVSVSGGGGHVGPNGGYVAAPQVSTSSTDVQSLWIRTDEGRDDHYSLVGSTAAVAAGQRVVMILATPDNSTSSWPVVLVNVNSQRYHLLGGVQSLARRLVNPPNLLGPIGMGLLSFVIGAGMMIHFDRYSPWHDLGLLPMLFGPGFCFVWLVVSAFRSNARFETTCKRLAARVDALGQATLTSAVRR